MHVKSDSHMLKSIKTPKNSWKWLPQLLQKNIWFRKMKKVRQEETTREYQWSTKVIHQFQPRWKGLLYLHAIYRKKETGVWCFGETVICTQHLYHKCFVYWYEQEAALVCQNWCLWELSVEHNAATQETLKTETVGLFFEASLTLWKLRTVPSGKFGSFEYS